jgi:hypothetical protein
MNKHSRQTSPELIRSVTSGKQKLQYVFAALLIVTIAAAFVGKQFINADALWYVVALVAVPLWSASMFLIFQLNRKINSIPTAVFRVLISLVPILALYVVYRTAYEADQFARSEA